MVKRTAGPADESAYLMPTGETPAAYVRRAVDAMRADPDRRWAPVADALEPFLRDAETLWPLRGQRTWLADMNPVLPTAQAYLAGEHGDLVDGVELPTFIRPTVWEVGASALLDHVDGEIWGCQVEYHGPGRYAVRRTGRWLTHKGKWVVSPSRKTRWPDLRGALAAAVEALPNIRTNFLTTGQVAYIVGGPWQTLCADSVAVIATRLGCTVFDLQPGSALLLHPAAGWHVQLRADDGQVEARGLFNDAGGLADNPDWAVRAARYDDLPDGRTLLAPDLPPDQAVALIAQKVLSSYVRSYRKWTERVAAIRGGTSGGEADGLG